MSKEIDTLDKEIREDLGPSQKPVFVTVLCILTFVGVGLTISTTLFSVFTMSFLEQGMNTMSDALSDSEAGLDFANSFRWTKFYYVLSIIGALLCLVGALFMWKLKRFGFYIYILGQLLPIFGSFMTMSSMYKGTFVGFGMVSTVLGMLFPIAFIIMYGLNLKHMK